MTEIRFLPHASNVFRNIERVSNTSLERNATSTFPAVLNAVKQSDSPRRDAAIPPRQAESAMTIARRQNIEAMLQQLIAYGKKHLCIESKQGSSALGTSASVSDCRITGDTLAESSEASNAIFPNEDHMDLCASHIQDATAWVAASYGNGPMNSMPTQWPGVAMPGLFVWVWIPVDNTRAPIVAAQPRRRRGLPATRGSRAASVIDSASDEL